MIRSFVNSPAHYQTYILKALASNADAIVIDLEDGVGSEEKEKAREGLKNIWDLAIKSKKKVFVRINTTYSVDGIKDVAFLIENNIKPEYIILPKMESDVEFGLNRKLFGRDVKLCPLIETPLGVSEARSIINCLDEGDFVFFGEADLTADLGIELYSEFVKNIKRQVVLFASCKNVNVVDSPCFKLKEIGVLNDEIDFSFKNGFAAKMAIHPDQIDLINRRFTERYVITNIEMDIVENHGESNTSVYNGNMIGPPMIRKILKKEAGRSGNCK